MSGVDRILLEVEHLPGSLADHDVADARFHERFDLASLEVNRGETFSRRDKQLVAARRVAVLMKVEAGTARNFSEPDHSMARVGVNPFSWRVSRRGGRRRGGLGKRTKTPPDIGDLRHGRHEKQCNCEKTGNAGHICSPKMYRQ